MFLARFAIRRPVVVLVAFAIVTAIAVAGAVRVRQSDDLLAFIPDGDRDVKVFRDVSRTFGALRVALLGIEAPAGDADVFAPETLGRLEAMTAAIKNTQGVDRVISLSSLVDFLPSEDSVQVVPLVAEPPKDAAAREKLRDRVMSLDHVVGNFVSRDARSLMILVFLSEGAPDRQTAHAIRAAAEQERGALRVVYGGAPFATASIFEEMQADQGVLTPLAALVILTVIILTYRDLVGVVLTLLTVAWASLVALGMMGYLGQPFTIASACFPVIVFASGCSYAVHLLGRYYVMAAPDGGDPRRKGASDARLIEAARIVGPPIAIATATTSAGFFSFLVMDIVPMKQFGLQCGVGVIGCWVATVLLVPALVALWPRGQYAPASTGKVGELLASVGLWAHRRRRLVWIGAVALGIATVGPMRRIEVRMEPRAFFRKGSDPYNAERFLAERFGGSQFLQVAVSGDLTDPATLRELQRLEDYARSIPGVTMAASIAGPLRLINDAMGGGRRLPDTAGQVRNLFFFLEGETSIKSLMNESRDQALVQIRIASDPRPVVAAIEAYLAQRLNRTPGSPTREGIAERLGWIVGEPLAGSVEGSIAAGLRRVADGEVGANARRVAILAVAAGEAGMIERVDRNALALRADLLGEAGGGQEGANLPADAPDLDKRAAAVLAVRRNLGTDSRAAVIAMAPSPEEGELLWAAVEERVQRAIRDAVVSAGTGVLGDGLSADQALLAREALGDLYLPVAIAPAPKALETALSGEPILDRGLSRSVAVNQERSLVVSIVTVLVLMTILFRSLYLGALSMLSALLTMAAIFGGMSLAGMPIDIGTSLVASIATGAGADFAMHYLWYLRRSTPQDVVRFVGPIMVVSTLLIAASFAVLGVGRSQPMRVFGLLASLSMAGSALLTFVLVPSLLRKKDASTAVDPVHPSQEMVR